MLPGSVNLWDLVEMLFYMDRMGMRDGIWVCTFEEFKGLSAVLRQSVIQVSLALASQENNTGAFTDLDIYLVDDRGQLIVGNNRVNDDGDPTEFLVFQARADAEANIMITSVNGPPPGNVMSTSCSSPSVRALASVASGPSALRTRTTG